MVSRTACLAIVTAVGCSKPNALFCGELVDKHGGAKGLNPLLGPGRKVCYLDRAACERESIACRSANPPRWHCYRWPSKAGGIGGSECFPALAACESTRQSLPDDTRADACTAVTEVFCLATAGKQIGCTQTLDECKSYAAMGLASDGDCHRRSP